MVEMERQNQRVLMITCGILFFCGGAVIAYIWGWIKYPSKKVIVVWTSSVFIASVGFIIEGN